MTQLLKEQNGLALAMIHAGFFPVPIENGFSLGLHSDRHTPLQIQQYRILQGALERSAYRDGFTDPMTALVWGAQALGIKPIADAPSGVPAGRTVADLQQAIRTAAQEKLGPAMENRAGFYSTMIVLLTEAVGGFAQAGRKHPETFGALGPMMAAILGTGDGYREQQTAKVLDRAATIIFLVTVVADQYGVDLKAIADEIPQTVGRRFGK